jgi:hypothetical protein
MVKTKKYIFARRFVGEPKEDDFEVVEEELPPLKKGGKTVKNKCLGRNNSDVLPCSYGVQSRSNNADSLLQRRHPWCRAYTWGFATFFRLLLRLLIIRPNTLFLHTDKKTQITLRWVNSGNISVYYGTTFRV